MFADISQSSIFRHCQFSQPTEIAGYPLATPAPGAVADMAIEAFAGQTVARVSERVMGIFRMDCYRQSRPAFLLLRAREVQYA